MVVVAVLVVTVGDDDMRGFERLRSIRVALGPAIRDALGVALGLLLLLLLPLTMTVAGNPGSCWDGACTCLYTASRSRRNLKR
jgi:hypothetical protein